MSADLEGKLRIRRKLAELKSEHRDLDAAIEALSQSSSGDQLRIARLKKRRLRLRDEINALEDAAIPDIIA
ncbi:MAG: YdcH family protein [Sphingomonadaceae bacterium]